MKNCLFFFMFLVSKYIVSFSSDCVPFSKNLYQPRSFSASNFREILLMKQSFINIFNSDEWQGTFSVATEYMQTFGRNLHDAIGAIPFWSGSSTMTIGINDGKSDLDAYQFGLGNVLKQGKISLTPCLQQIGSDLLVYFAHNKFHSGFFFKIKAPLGAMSTHVRLHEDTALLDTAENILWLSYPAPRNRYKNLTEAFNGGSVQLAGTLGLNGVRSSLHKPIALEKGKISCCKLTTICLADVSVTAGWNLKGSENGLFSFGCKLSCPTGNVPKGIFIMEPIFGRAGHWGIGVELSGFYKLWNNSNKDKALDFWLQGEVMHLASGRRPSWRSFDLKQNGPGSKYMLLQFYFASNATANNPTGYVPSFVTQAINVTTLPVISSFAVEGGTACMLDYRADNWNIGIGIDCWARSKESLLLDECNLVNQNVANLNDFAVLGRQISENALTAEGLFYCEPLARINKSQNVRINYNPVTQSGDFTPTLKDARLGANRIPSDLYDALDVLGAAEQRAVNIKLFGQLGYTWKYHKYNPNLSFYSSIEVLGFKSIAPMWSIGIQNSLNF